MADICNYKVIVKGKKNACYAFMNSMNRLDDIDVLEEKGTEDKYYLLFEGCCKYAIDMCCEPQNDPQPVEIPNNFDDNEDFESIEAFAECFIGCTVKDRSKMFGVEVLCNWIVDDFPDIDRGCYEHYKCGKEINDERPGKLEFEDYYFEGFEDYEEYDD